MKKKGFTLVELLAVIVILAVIALIAVPMILNVVEKSRNSAFKDSVLNAFGQVEYHLIENSLTSMPAEGITVTDLQIKNGNFESGLFVKNSDGKLEAINITDGRYCANGEMTELVVTKGECEAIVPTIEITVNKKTATITLEDSMGLVGYAITTVEEEPTEWTSIDNSQKEELTYTATSAGVYYVYAKNTLGKTSVSAFEIEAKSLETAYYLSTTTLSLSGWSTSATYTLSDDKVLYYAGAISGTINMTHSGSDSIVMFYPNFSISKNGNTITLTQGGTDGNSKWYGGNSTIVLLWRYTDESLNDDADYYYSENLTKAGAASRNMYTNEWTKEGVTVKYAALQRSGFVSLFDANTSTNMSFSTSYSSNKGWVNVGTTSTYANQGHSNASFTMNLIYQYD